VAINDPKDTSIRTDLRSTGTRLDRRHRDPRVDAPRGRDKATLTVTRVGVKREAAPRASASGSMTSQASFSWGPPLPRKTPDPLVTPALSQRTQGRRLVTKSHQRPSGGAMWMCDGLAGREAGVPALTRGALTSRGNPGPPRSRRSRGASGRSRGRSPVRCRRRCRIRVGSCPRRPT
jgi:hypothetical protein